MLPLLRISARKSHKLIYAILTFKTREGEGVVRHSSKRFVHPLAKRKLKASTMPDLSYEGHTLLSANSVCSESEADSPDDDDDLNDGPQTEASHKLYATASRRRLYHGRRRRFLRRSVRFVCCILLVICLFYILVSCYTRVKTRSAPISDWSSGKSVNISDYVLPRKNTTLRAPQNLCQQNIFLVIVVSSALENFSQRQTIRDTWGNITKFGYAEFANLHAHMHTKYLMPEFAWQRRFSAFLYGTNASNQEVALPVRVVFLLGRQQSDAQNFNQTSTRLNDECHTHNDIIQEDFVDSYNNLTVKSVIGLKYMIKHCVSRSLFYMKCDDDTFVNVPNLLHVLQGGTMPIYNQTLELFDTESYQVLAPSSRLNVTSSDFLLGHAFCGARPISDVRSKWYMPYYMYPGTVYPRYLSGAAYVISVQAIRRLYEVALNTSLIYMEDVYLTGVCAEAARLPRQNHPLFSYMRSRHMCAYKATITQHNLKADDLLEAWQFVSNYSITCPPPPDDHRYQLLHLRKRPNC